MTNIDDIIIDDIISIVRKANKIVMSHLGKNDPSLKKGEYYSKQLVTEVETEVEDFLFENLAEHYPGYNFCGEEKGFVNNKNSTNPRAKAHGICRAVFGTENCRTKVRGIKPTIFNKKSEYTWLVDPISATNNYIHKMPHFAVVVSLLKNDKPVLAVVLDSFYNELFYAMKGGGAYLNKESIKVSNISELKKAIITPCWSKKDSKTIEEGLQYSDKLSELSTTRRIGSLALQLAWIGAGRIDAFIQNENEFFSLMGGSLIVKEAGGTVTDFDGKEYSKDSKTIVASNGRIHKELMNHLNEVKSKRG